AHGECNYWHRNGQLKKKCYYSDGLLHGEYKEWNETGLLIILKNYDHGLLHGSCTLWDETGNLSGQRQYEHGNLHGKKMIWYPNGWYTETDYKHGRMSGNYVSYRADNSIDVRSNYLNNTLDGIYEEWY